MAALLSWGLAPLLRDALSDYITPESLNSEHVGAGLLSRSLDLTNLRLKRSVVDMLGLPVRLELGTVRHVRIALDNIQAQTVTVLVEDVVLVLHTEYDIEAEAKRQKGLADAAAEARKKKQAQAPDSGLWMTRTANKYIEGLLDNMTIEVSNVRIRVVDDATIPGTAFAFDLLADKVWYRNSVHGPGKDLVFQNIGLHWNPSYDVAVGGGTTDAEPLEPPLQSLAVLKPIEQLSIRMFTDDSGPPCYRTSITCTKVSGLLLDGAHTQLIAFISGCVDYMFQIAPPPAADNVSVPAATDLAVERINLQVVDTSAAVHRGRQPFIASFRCRDIVFESEGQGMRAGVQGIEVRVTSNARGPLFSPDPSSVPSLDWSVFPAVLLLRLASVSVALTYGTEGLASAEPVLKGIQANLLLRPGARSPLRAPWASRADVWSQSGSSLSSGSGAGVGAGSGGGGGISIGVGTGIGVGVGVGGGAALGPPTQVQVLQPFDVGLVYKAMGLAASARGEPQELAFAHASLRDTRARALDHNRTVGWSSPAAVRVLATAKLTVYHPIVFTLSLSEMVALRSILEAVQGATSGSTPAGRGRGGALSPTSPRLPGSPIPLTTPPPLPTTAASPAPPLSESSGAEQQPLPQRPPFCGGALLNFRELRLRFINRDAGGGLASMATPFFGLMSPATGPDSATPIANVVLSNVKLRAFSSAGRSSAHLGVTLGVNYHNSRLACWEPALEPWPMRLSFALSPPVPPLPPLFISWTSNQVLNLNLTEALFETVGDVLASTRASSAMVPANRRGARGAGRGAGRPGGSRGRAAGGAHNGPDAGPGGALNRKSLMDAQGRVVCQVALRHGSKFLCVTSTLMLCNQLRVPLYVALVKVGPPVSARSLRASPPVYVWTTVMPAKSLVAVPTQFLNLGVERSRYRLRVRVDGPDDAPRALPGAARVIRVDDLVTTQSSALGSALRPRVRATDLDLSYAVQSTRRASFHTAACFRQDAAARKLLSHRLRHADGPGSHRQVSDHDDDDPTHAVGSDSDDGEEPDGSGGGRGGGGLRRLRRVHGRPIVEDVDDDVDGDDETNNRSDDGMDGSGDGASGVVGDSLADDSDTDSDHDALELDAPVQAPIGCAGVFRMLSFHTPLAVTNRLAKPVDVRLVTPAELELLQATAGSMTQDAWVLEKPGSAEANALGGSATQTRSAMSSSSSSPSATTQFWSQRRLAPNQRLAWHHQPSEDRLYMSLCLPGFQWSPWVTLHRAWCGQKWVPCTDATGATLNIGVEVKRSRCGGLRAVLYVPFWIVNKTSMPLVYKHRTTKGVWERDELRRVAGQSGSEEAMDRYLRRQNRGDMGLLSLLQPTAASHALSAPFMVDHTDFETRRCEIQIKGPGCRWSNPVSVGLVGSQTVVSMKETTSAAPDLPPSTAVVEGGGSGAGAGVVTGGGGHPSEGLDVRRSQSPARRRGGGGDGGGGGGGGTDGHGPPVVSLSTSAPAFISSMSPRSKASLVTHPARLVTFGTTVSARRTHSRTLIITIAPRFVLINASHRSLRVTQASLPHDVGAVTLHVGERVPFHWPRADGDKRIRVRYGESFWTWSGALLPTQLGETIVRVRNTLSHQTALLRVEVRPSDTAPTLLILIQSLASPGSGVPHDVGTLRPPPYRIRNLTVRALRIQQAGVTNDSERLLAYETTDYAWAEPLVDRKELLVTLDATSTVIGSFPLDQLGEHAVQVSSSAEVPQRFSVQITAEGPTRVLLITDADRSDLTAGGSGSGATSVPALTTRKLVIPGGDASKPMLLGYPAAVTIDFAGIGFALIDGRPRELVYGKLEALTLEVVDGLEEQKLALRIARLEVDNQAVDTPYPCLLEPIGSRRRGSGDGPDGGGGGSNNGSGGGGGGGGGGSSGGTAGGHGVGGVSGGGPGTGSRLNVRVAADHPFLEFTVVKTASAAAVGIHYIKHCLLRLAPLDVAVDGLLVADVLSMASRVSRTVDAALLTEDGPTRVSTGFVSEPEAAPPAPMIPWYFANLLICPTAIKLTFRSRGGLGGVLGTVVSIEDAHLRFERVAVSQLLVPFSDLMGQISRHYEISIRAQWYKLLAGSVLLRVPTFVIGSFTNAIFPGEYRADQAWWQQVASLFTVRLPWVAVTTASTTLIRSLRFLHMLDRYSGYRPSGPLVGAVQGVSGLVVAPSVGLARDGVNGLALGLLGGAVGLVVKPIVGMFASRGLRAMLRTINVSDPEARRRRLRLRPPRFFRPGRMALKPYSFLESEGEELLARAGDGIFRSETYVSHFKLGRSAVVITEQGVLCVSTHGLRYYAVVWRVPFQDVRVVKVVGSHLVRVYALPARARGVGALVGALRPPLSRIDDGIQTNDLVGMRPTSADVLLRDPHPHIEAQADGTGIVVTDPVGGDAYDQDGTVTPGRLMGTVGGGVTRHHFVFPHYDVEVADPASAQAIVSAVLAQRDAFRRRRRLTSRVAYRWVQPSDGLALRPEELAHFSDQEGGRRRQQSGGVVGLALVLGFAGFMVKALKRGRTVS